MSSKAKTLTKGSLLRSLQFFANCIIALALMPFIIHSLGDRMYGLWILIGSFFGFYGFFDFGLSSAVQRYISRALGKGDLKEANAVVNNSLFLFFLIGLLSLVVLV
ncbi:MATE family efflux transporter, partial [Candidatus Omnitrophota bacterium]